MRASQQTVSETSRPQPSTFVRQLTAHRERRNWSQSQLATRLGFDSSYVSHIENGSKPPTMAFAERCDSPDAFDLPGTFADLCLANGLGRLDSAALSPRESVEFIKKTGGAKWTGANPVTATATAASA
jgi:transcriptional regulator with XRE-family HTH domain